MSTMQTKRWLIKDAATRFCMDDMKANAGEWDTQVGAWVFAIADDAANALSALYDIVHTRRATVAQREILLEMISDGTSYVAWNVDVQAIDGSWLANVSRDEARRLITQGIAARRVLGLHPFEEMPAYLSQHQFYEATFARELSARRAQFRRRARRS